jgi:transcriptional regulator with XRE-family HTH domain
VGSNSNWRTEGTLGFKIWLFRSCFNQSQRELAKKLNISHTYLSKIENNKEIPSKKLIIEISEALYTDTPTLDEWLLLAGKVPDRCPYCGGDLSTPPSGEKSEEV